MKFINPKQIKSVFSIDGFDNAIIFDAPFNSGLANQLRGLTSTMLMAREQNRKFYVHWGNIEDMKGIESLADLFESPRLNYTRTNHFKMNRIQRFFCYFKNRRVLRFKDWLKHELRVHRQFNTILCDMITDNVSFFFPTIIISSYYSFHAGPITGLAFYEKRHRLYKRFIPVRQLREAYQNFMQNHFGSYTLGVHVRTRNSMRSPGQIDIVQDNSKYQIRFDLYFQMIDQTIDEHPHAKIFLATDNINNCRPLLERYPDRIVMYPQKTINGMVSRFTAEDHKNALIDLYLLSNTQKLLGSDRSTFSYEAAVIGNVPLIEICQGGLRQEYFLVDDKTVTIDFRDNGIGEFTKEMVYSPRCRGKSYFGPVHIASKEIVEFFYGELKKTCLPVVFDVGARTGCFSLVSKFIKECMFFAFEPDKMLFDLLTSNLKLNDLENKVQAVNLPMLNQPGERLSGITKNDRSTKGIFGQPDEKPGKFFETSKGDTLDSFACRYDVEKLDFIKIDAKGAESNILSGGKEILTHFRPKLLVKIHGKGLPTFSQPENDLINFIEAMGYSHQLIFNRYLYCAN